MTTTLAKETTPSPPSPYRFSREAVMAQGNKIRLSDSDPDNGLDLYCYNRCSNDDPRIVRECRGVVFNNERIVLKTFPFTFEYPHKDTDILSAILGSDFNEYKFYDAHEGSLLRLFFWNER